MSRPAARGRADERERRQVERHGARAGALAEDDRQPAVLHRRVERLLDRAVEAVDLVDEEDRARLERGQERGDVGLALERRAGGLHERRRSSSAAMMCASEVLPSPGGPASRTWSSGSPRRRGRLDEDRELVGDLLLVDEVGEPLRAQRAVELVLAAGRRRRVDRGSSGARPCSVRPMPGSRSMLTRASLLGGAAQRRADQLLRASRPSAPSSSARPRRACSRGAPGPRAPASAGRRRAPAASAGIALLELAGDLLAQLDDDPLGGPLADARAPPGSALRRRPRSPGSSSRGRAAGEDRDRDLRADPGDRDQVQEEVALLLAWRSRRADSESSRATSWACSVASLPRAGTALSVSAETVSR